MFCVPVYFVNKQRKTVFVKKNLRFLEVLIKILQNSQLSISSAHCKTKASKSVGLSQTQGFLSKAAFFMAICKNIFLNFLINYFIIKLWASYCYYYYDSMSDHERSGIQMSALTYRYVKIMFFIRWDLVYAAFVGMGG